MNMLKSPLGCVGGEVVGGAVVPTVVSGAGWDEAGTEPGFPVPQPPAPPSDKERSVS